MAIDNPPAFPRLGEGFGSPKYDEPGMSLRDWFAGQAVAGLISGGMADGTAFTRDAVDLISNAAYAMADAMLAARASSAPVREMEE